MQESLVSLLSHGCLCKFSSDRIGGLRMECLTQTSAILRGWIYGEGADPATKYTTLLQQSADNKAVFTLGQQKVTRTTTYFGCLYMCMSTSANACQLFVYSCVIVIDCTCIYTYCTLECVHVCQWHCMFLAELVRLHMT